jgi:hypothetical protein
MNSSDVDSCRYLYLRELTEPRDNALSVIVDEGLIGEPEDVVLPGGVPLNGSSPIEVTPASRAFELSWPSYVAYSVRNESFCVPDGSEEFQGQRLCRYSRSHYLDFVARATIARTEYPGPLVHYGVICLNHVIDVVSIDEPVVRPAARHA